MLSELNRTDGKLHVDNCPVIYMLKLVGVVFRYLSFTPCHSLLLQTWMIWFHFILIISIALRSQSLQNIFILENNFAQYLWKKTERERDRVVFVIAATNSFSQNNKFTVDIGQCVHFMETINLAQVHHSIARCDDMCTQQTQYAILWPTQSSIASITFNWSVIHSQWADSAATSAGTANRCKLQW